MIDHLKTFVLALFRQRFMGTLVSEFEKLDLNIKEMRCMVVTPDFGREHLVNIKWDPEAFSESIALPFASWIDCIAHGLVTAMIVEGDDVVQKVRELSKKQQLPFQVVEKEIVYTSDSGYQAKIDIDSWFDSTNFDETIDFEQRSRESTKVVFLLPGGRTYGPLDQVKDVWKCDASYKIKQDFKANLFMEKMCVLLIKSLAFHENSVGKNFDAIEANCLGLRGLKLVKKAKHPSKARDTNYVSYGDEYGVDVVAFDLESSFKIVPGDSKVINFRNKRFEIGSNYLYKIEQGEGVLEVASDFFYYGFNVWAFENQFFMRGCMFEASLVGLTSLLN